MSMTLANAKIYVAQVLGGQDDPNMLLSAGDAIAQALTRWARLKDWTYLRKDNSQGFAVAACTIDVDGVTVTSTGNLNGVNPGVAVTGTGIPASTTVSAITRNTTTGSVTSFTLSAASTPATITITFAGYIPLVPGTNLYNPPADFNRPYSARLLVNQRVLTYLKTREFDRKVVDISTQGTPSHYTVYNPYGFTAASEHKNIVVYRTPSEADSMFLRYYRSPNATLDPLDVPDDYIYALLDIARGELIKSKNGDDARLQAYLAIAQNTIAELKDDDEIESEDEDLRFISQMEVSTWPRSTVDIWDDWL